MQSSSDGVAEPQPVFGWRDLANLIGWSAILLGFFLLLFDCGRITPKACSPSYIAYSIYAEFAGGLLLVLRAFVMARDKKTVLRHALVTLAVIVGAVLLALLILYIDGVP